MTEPHLSRPESRPPSRLPIKAPAIPAPPLFTERRIRHRRVEDRTVHDERAFLARSLDVLAADRPAEERLASLLRLLARTVGARRAAVLGQGVDRLVCVSLIEGEDPAAAQALAAWLDAWSPRSRAERAAAGVARVGLAIDGSPHGPADGPADGPATPGAASDESTDHKPTSRKRSSDGAHYACVKLPGPGAVVLGFDFRDARGADSLSDRLTEELGRHAAAALAVVTQQLAAERERVDLLRRDTERSRFVSTVAHELRTPLTGLNGYLDLILAGRVEDAAVEREFLERSQGIVDSIAELVGDLLEVSRLESGTLNLEIRPLSVHEVGSRIVDRLAPIALDRGVELHADLPPRMRTAMADRRRVEQILTNLTGNAIKFTPSGGSIELRGWFDGPVAMFAVRDDGAGIGQEDRARIFERFYRMSGHDRITGTGLGLPIARDLAAAMGGGLDVASVPGSGSSFVLVLPGPTPVDLEAIETALAAAVAAEEVALEERAVLRAIHAAARPGGRTLPRILSMASPGGTADADAEDADPQSGPHLMAQRGTPARPVLLRAIDGTGGGDAPSPA